MRTREHKVKIRFIQKAGKGISCGSVYFSFVKIVINKVNIVLAWVQPSNWLQLFSRLWLNLESKPDYVTTFSQGRAFDL